MTDKERLEDIKLKFNNTVDIMLYVPYEDVKFLIEQAERAKELERKIERYREALELIREQGSWGLFTDKYAKIAHEALEGEEIEQEIS